jgi:hypothetical protein
VAIRSPPVAVVQPQRHARGHVTHVEASQGGAMPTFVAAGAARVLAAPRDAPVCAAAPAAPAAALRTNALKSTWVLLLKAFDWYIENYQ